MSNSDGPPISDRYAQFLILVGQLSLAAANAKLPVTFELDDGRELTGVPEVSTASGGPDELDDTGLRSLVRINGGTAHLEAVRRCTVRAPEA